MIRMPGTSYQGPFLPLTDQENVLKIQLRTIVDNLASEIGERNLWNKETLYQSSEYIKKFFKNLNLDSTEMTMQIENQKVCNIIFEKKGVRYPEEIIVIGAHYDTVFNSPGADDNTSGVAGILMMAKQLASINLSKTLRFVAFVNEEPPFFYSKQMGSYQYAKQCRQKKEKIVGMYSIESIGYYSEEQYTQSYPFPFNLVYPNVGNFIGFVSNIASRKLILKTIRLFRDKVSFPSEGLYAPSWIPGIAWSDQWSFWRHGYQAVMVTDTALFRNPNYHTPLDLPNTLDYNRFARVVGGFIQVLIELANE